MATGQAGATQFFERGTGGKLWEIVIKICVPVSILAGAAMIRNEIVDAQQAIKIERLESDIGKTAPLSIQTDVRALLTLNQSISDRLARMETKIERIEKDGNQ